MDNATAVLRAWSGRPDRAVIFDFNGTLSDDEPLLLHIFAELFEEALGWHLTRDDYIARLAGLSDREIVERVVHEHGAGDAALVERLLEGRRVRYRELVAQDSPIKPGTRDLVERLASAGVPMGVVTGAQRPDVEMVLRRSGVAARVQVIVSVEDVVRGKPDPEGFLAGAHLLGVDPASVLAFEDSVAGARSARAAGMAVIGVRGGGADEADLACVTDALVPELDATILDDVPGWSARLEPGVDGDAHAVGAEEVEGVLDR